MKGEQLALTQLMRTVIIGLFSKPWVMGLAAVLAATGAWAAAAEQTVPFTTMTIQLLGGLALFLFGIELMSDSLKAVAGEGMRVILARLTTNRFMGATTGAFVTAIIQSSSVTTVLIVGFTTAGLMSFSQSIGVIMGANIGTTITAQILAFKIVKAAWAMVAVGFTMNFFFKQEKVVHIGAILMGLGLVFVGMNVMSDAMAPLRTYQPFLDLMQTMESPLYGILVAAAFTALIQSSSATTGIVIVMAGQGLISLPAGIALAFGANIGTCVTAMLASIGKPREALRAAVCHVLFNVAGVVVWFAFIDQLAQLVTAFSPVHGDLSGTARLAADAPRQIANAHTVFNISNTLIFIWFTPQMARLVEWLVPDRPLEEEEAIRAKFLDDELLRTPSLALDRVRLEIRRMGGRVQDMLSQAMPAILNGSISQLDAIKNMDEDIDSLHALIVSYLGKISRLELNEKQKEELLGLMEAVNNLEGIGDLIETELYRAGVSRTNHHLEISEATAGMLRDFHAVVSETVDNAIEAVASQDAEASKAVLKMKKKIARISQSAAAHEAMRLVADEPHRIEAYTIEIEIIEELQRVYYHARRMARTVPPIPGNKAKKAKQAEATETA